MATEEPVAETPEAVPPVIDDAIGTEPEVSEQVASEPIATTEEIPPATEEEIVSEV